MKIEEVVGDVILVILENYDPLKKIGIKIEAFIFCVLFFFVEFILGMLN